MSENSRGYNKDIPGYIAVAKCDVCKQSEAPRGETLFNGHFLAPHVIPDSKDGLLCSGPIRAYVRTYQFVKREDCKGLPENLPNAKKELEEQENQPPDYLSVNNPTTPYFAFMWIFMAIGAVAIAPFGLASVFFLYLSGGFAALSFATLRSGMALHDRHVKQLNHNWLAVNAQKTIDEYEKKMAIAAAEEELNPPHELPSSMKKGMLDL